MPNTTEKNLSSPHQFHDETLNRKFYFKHYFIVFKYFLGIKTSVAFWKITKFNIKELFWKNFFE